MKLMNADEGLSRITTQDEKRLNQSLNNVRDELSANRLQQLVPSTRRAVQSKESRGISRAAAVCQDSRTGR